MWRLAEFFMRPFLPLGFRPLRKADFNNPQLRQGIARFLPGINLNDSSTQQAMRDFRLLLSLIDQVRGLSRIAYAQAARVNIPALVIQGSRDDVVQTPQTRKMISRFPAQPRYVEVDSTHDLISASHAAWPQVDAAVADFARGVADTSPGPSHAL